MEDQEVDFYCKNCRKSFKISYVISGNDEAIIFPGMALKCHYCKRVLRFKKMMEKDLLISAKDSMKIYI